MYAIAFDLDTETLKQSYPNPSYTNAYGDIRKVLEPLGLLGSKAASISAEMK